MIKLENDNATMTTYYICSSLTWMATEPGRNVLKNFKIMAQWQRILASQSSVLNTNGHRTWKYCANTTVNGFRTDQSPTVRSLRVQYYKANFHVIGTSGRKTNARNGPTPASFCLFSVLFKQTIQFLQQINVKKCHVHLVYGAGIQTHNFLKVSCLA